MIALALSAHPDDSELGAGGMLSKIDTVVHYIFTQCVDTGVTGKEIENAQKALNITDYHVYNYTNKELYKTSAQIRQVLEKARDNINPDMVLVPCRGDTHQDHQTVTSEALKVFKKNTILGYILPWNAYIVEPTMFYRLTDREVGRKIASLRYYKSQSNKLYMNASRIRGWASYVGWKIGADYAEEFEVIRMVV
ncbi:hypothetical protein DRH14_01850 [Candidatus Shapirobacteria bacterium]|nr:MAG: hypothetical protein DRH14_01850 [Candidatus Shapirobacteria bacterium]